MILRQLREGSFLINVSNASVEVNGILLTSKFGKREEVVKQLVKHVQTNLLRQVFPRPFLFLEYNFDFFFLILGS